MNAALAETQAPIDHAFPSVVHADIPHDADDSVEPSVSLVPCTAGRIDCPSMPTCGGGWRCLVCHRVVNV
jgi:hypothetical protein